MNDFGFAPKLKKVDNGSLWRAITKYRSDEISVKALVAFTDVVLGLSNYNIPDLLKMWDTYHEYANK